MKRATPEVLIVSLALLAWALIDPVGSIMAKSGKAQDQPVVRVWIYDYAHVGWMGLNEADGEAARIFASVGVRVLWTVCSQAEHRDGCQGESPDADFFVRVLPASMSSQWNSKPRALGESVISPTAEGPLPGGTANVFYDRVEHISYLWNLDPAEILGEAMAHELGHLLLGADHSGQGIMKARWSARDLELAKGAKLRFLPAEISALQRAARSLQNHRSLAITTQR